MNATTGMERGRRQEAEMDKRGWRLERVKKSVGKSAARIKRGENEGRRQVEYEYLHR